MGKEGCGVGKVREGGKHLEVVQLATFWDEHVRVEVEDARRAVGVPKNDCAERNTDATEAQLTSQVDGGLIRAWGRTMLVVRFKVPVRLVVAVVHVNEADVHHPDAALSSKDVLDAKVRVLHQRSRRERRSDRGLTEAREGRGAREVQAILAHHPWAVKDTCTSSPGAVSQKVVEVLDGEMDRRPYADVVDGVEAQLSRRHTVAEDEAHDAALEPAVLREDNLKAGREGGGERRGERKRRG